MIICVDPGHGGRRPGAIGPSGLREDEVNLFVVHLLRHGLADMGYGVVLTRSGAQDLHNDLNTDLDLRAEVSNRAKATCFISIHCNSVHDHGVGGFEVYHYPGSKGGQRLAESVLASLQGDGLVQGGPERTGYKLKDRGVRKSAFRVLKKTNAPAILIELAFISNPVEEALLMDKEWLVLMADSIAEGINGYLVGRHA